MNVNLVVMPGSPALVPELSPGDAAGTGLLRALRTLLIDAAAVHRRIELVGSRDQAWYTALAGSLRAWGAPEVNVGMGHYLPELVQRYALGEAASQVTDVRGSLGQIDPGVLTLLALDGSAGLDPRAPLADLPAAPAVDQWCRAVLAGQRPAVKSAEELCAAGVIEPASWLELAALQPRSAELIQADTTLGVGRYLAGWEI